MKYSNICVLCNPETVHKGPLPMDKINTNTPSIYKKGRLRCQSKGRLLNTGTILGRGTVTLLNTMVQNREPRFSLSWQVGEAVSMCIHWMLDRKDFEGKKNRRDLGDRALC